MGPSRTMWIVLGLLAACIFMSPTYAEDPLADEICGHADRHGDPLPPGAVQRLGTQRWRHLGGRVAVSPDRRLVAVAGDGLVVLLDARDGRRVGAIPVAIRRPVAGALSLENDVHAMQFTPDGKQLAVAVRSFEVQFYDVETRQRKRTLRSEVLDESAAGRFGAALLFSSDGRQLAWRIPSVGVRVYDLTTGSCHVRPDGWLPTSAGEELLSLEHDAESYECRIRDLRSGEIVRSFIGPEITPIYMAAFSADGRWAAFSTRGGVHLWDAAAGRESHKLDGEEAEHFLKVEFSPDSKHLTAAAEYTDKVVNTKHLWNVQSGQELWRIEPCLTDHYCDCFFDNERLAFLLEARLRLHEVSTGKAIGDESVAEGDAAQVYGVRYLGDGESLARLSIDGVDVFNAATGAHVQHLLSGLTVRCWAWEGGAGEEIVAINDDAVGIRIRGVHDEAGEKVIDLDSKIAVSLAFSQGGEILSAYVLGFSPTWRGLVIYDSDAARRLKEWPNLGGYVLPWALDREMLATSRRGVGVEMWDLHASIASEEPVRTSLRDSDYCRPLAASSDGGLLAVAVSPRGQNDSQLQVYETSSGLLLWQSGRQTRYIEAAAFSTDGRRLAYGTGADLRLYQPLPEAAVRAEIPPPRIQVYDLTTTRTVTSFEGFLGNPKGLAFSPDGTRLASAHQDSTCLVWALPPPDSIADLEADLAPWWRKLAASPAEAQQAVAIFAASGQRAARFLEEHLQPTTNPDPERVAKLMAELDADSFQSRERAATELRRMGPAVVEALEQTAKTSKSAELVGRCQTLISQLTGLLTTEPEQLRQVRAIRALRQNDAPAARALLRKLAGGANNNVQTRHAKWALKNLDEPKR